MKDAMSRRTHTITTVEELLNAPTDLGRCELVRGELIMMSPGRGRHAAVGMKIGRSLLNFVEAHGLGEVFDRSAGYVVSRNPDTVREPGPSNRGRHVDRAGTAARLLAGHPRDFSCGVMDVWHGLLVSRAEATCGQSTRAPVCTTSGALSRLPCQQFFQRFPAG
jgi:hypothetical protein